MTPSVPTAVRVSIHSKNSLEIQFNKPDAADRLPISAYKVQWDTASTFNSGNFGAPKEEVLVYSNQTSRVSDVQLVTVSTDLGFTPYGTFVLSFLGQETGELDYNISANGLKQALEKLSTVRQVSVYRTLLCSSEAGQNNCGTERGYTWMVTFVDVIDQGYQSELYLDSFESNLNHRLQVRGNFLTACSTTSPFRCYMNASAQAFVESTEEIQQVCLCNNVASTFTILGQSVSLQSPSSSSLKNALETVSGLGRVTVSSATTLPIGSCRCPATASSFTVTFNSFMGDVPLMTLTPGGTAQEVQKGVPQFVDGVGDYKVVLKRPAHFTPLTPV
jgi:hypothetical protein